MSSAPRVSVVIPLFNKRNYIGRAIQSIRDQTISCREIIVVDDGSTDGGPEVVERVQDPRIRLLRQANQGPSVTRNRGIAVAQNDLIAFLDADDEWKPWFLETILRLHGQYASAGVYATAYEIHEFSGRVFVPRYREIPTSPWEGIIPNYFRSALQNSPVWSSAVAVRREVFDTIGRFVPFPGLGEDAEFWARIALRYPIAFSWRVGAIYHMEAENRYCDTVVAHVFTTDCFERAMQSLGVPSHLLPDVAEFVAVEKLMAAARQVVSGQPRMARRILQDCRTHRFLRYKLWWWWWSLLPVGLVRLAWRGKRWLRRHFQG